MLRKDLDKAEDIFRESLVLAWDLRLDGLVQHSLEGFACVAGAHGEAQRAARLWGAGPSPAPGEGRPQGYRLPRRSRRPHLRCALGFDEAGEVPNPDAEPVMAIRKWGDVLLIADALVGMPFPDSERERQIQRGPRGLRVVIGLMVDDLDATYAYCIEEGCEITCEPMNEAWGVWVFVCLDPFGYEWEFSQPIPGMAPADGTAAV